MTRPMPLWVPAALLLLMSLSAAVGLAYRPEPVEQRRVSADAPFLLERDVPERFGDWTAVPNGHGLVTTPELQQKIDLLYSQVLTRTYRNSNGYHVMLVIAYGEDQRGGLQAHRPEVCYPAQGFKLLSNEEAELITLHGPIDGRRLLTRNGERHEPVTYWFNVGGKPLTGWLERRVEVVRLVFSGRTPDGLLFRVSSVDLESARAWHEQQRFVKQLMTALRPEIRQRMAGL
jgi:EpsI family protein